MILRHNPHSFLTGDDPFISLVPLHAEPRGSDHEVVFERHHEGYIGKPHGGLAMGLCLDAWLRASTDPYPMTARFKFGGSGLSLGETARFSVARNGSDAELRAEISKEGDKTPYLRAELGTAAPNDLAVGVPQKPPSDTRLLPYYRNCFVCGHYRTIPGLKRRFHFHPSEEGCFVTVPWGEGDDRDRGRLFLNGKGELHPAVLSSLFDENTGWAGFMAKRQAGLSVKLDVTILRPVSVDERLLFVGRPTGIRGNPRSPRFFLAAGSVLALGADGEPELVAHGKGEWIIFDHLTQQIKEHLLPENDWEWVFVAE
ncbi:MAG: hypothetical protein AB1646_13265 [Thermodesulfobacteriota bacterium]